LHELLDLSLRRLQFGGDQPVNDLKQWAAKPQQNQLLKALESRHKGFPALTTGVASLSETRTGSRFDTVTTLRFGVEIDVGRLLGLLKVNGDRQKAERTAKRQEPEMDVAEGCISRGWQS
jgi:hypothetical protein